MFFQKNYKIPKIKREKNLHLEIYPDWLISELLLTKELEKVKRTGDTRPLKRIIRRRRDKQTRDKIRFKKKAEMSRRLRQEDQGSDDSLYRSNTTRRSTIRRGSM